MLPTTGRGTRHSGTLLLADISGYTGFLTGVANAHRALIIESDEPPQAYDMLSRVLDAMLAALEPTFRLAKLEGDAVFAVADSDETADRSDSPALTGDDVLRSIRACYTAFRSQLDQAGSQWTCECNACVRLNELDLKFVLHRGDFVVHRILDREELAGPDVIVVHRLLKNHARELVGNRPYALITDRALAELGMAGDDMAAGIERYEDLPEIPVHVLALA